MAWEDQAALRLTFFLGYLLGLAATAGYDEEPNQAANQQGKRSGLGNLGRRSLVSLVAIMLPFVAFALLMFPRPASIVITMENYA